MSLKIRDKFITELVLPNESIACWIKYDEVWNFDKIRISYEDPEDAIPDIQFKNLLSVVYVGIPLNNTHRRTIDISRADLLLDGFIGFVCKYSIIPPTSKDIDFKIDFFDAEHVSETVTLKTSVSRPILRIAHAPTESVVITSSTPENLKPKKLNIVNMGSSTASDIILWVNSTNKNIRARLIPVQRTKETFGFFKEAFTTQDVIMEISGVGASTLEYIAEYSDELGNRYKDKIMELSVTSQLDKSTSILLYQELEQKSPIHLFTG